MMREVTNVASSWFILMIGVGAVVPVQAQTIDERTTLDVAINPTTLRLNQAACEDAEVRDVQISLSNPSSPLVASGVFYAWWQTTGDCNRIPDTSELLAQEQLVAGDPLVSTGTLFFPDDVTDDEFTTQSILDEIGACPDGSDEAKLCLGVDLDSTIDGSGNNQLEATEPQAGITFRVDAIAPPQPGPPVVKPRDSALGLSVSVPEEDDAEVDDITSWLVKLRPLDDANTEETCEQWPVEPIERTPSVGGPEAELSVPAENGITYEVCVAAVDSVDNVGPFSEPSTGAPRDECDFLECYPEDARLKTGYCGAVGPLIWGPVGVLLLWRAARRRKARSEERA